MNPATGRVVIVLNWLELGGAERQALLYARHLAQQGRSVEIWGLDPREGQVSAACRALGIPCRAGMRRRGRGFIGLGVELVRFARALRATRTDVVLPYGLTPNLICGMTWRLGGARVGLWNQRDAGLDFTGRRLERAAVQRASRRIANSACGARFLEERFDLEAGSVTVVRNGVALDAPAASRDQWRQRLELGDEVPVAVMLANVHPNKDHLTLVDAWRHVVELWRARTGTSGREPTLLLAGRLDPGHEPVVARIAERHLGAHVRLLGPVADVAGLLSAIDVAVFSSRLEGCPNGVVEPMAAGLAVAATDIPGVREAVGDDGARWLAAEGDAAGLAARIVELLADPASRGAAGRQNAERVHALFGPAQMCAAMDTVVGLDQ